MVVDALKSIANFVNCVNLLAPTATAMQASIYLQILFLLPDAGLEAERGADEVRDEELPLVQRTLLAAGHERLGGHCKARESILGRNSTLTKSRRLNLVAI